MVSSVNLRVNDFIILEYIYTGNTLSYVTNQVGIQRVENEHLDEVTIINDIPSKSKTNNTVDDTVVQLENGKYVLLDRDTAYYYPNVDPKVNVIDQLYFLPSPFSVKYDTVRIHILSGYDFQDILGMTFSIYWKLNNDKLMRVCNIMFNYSQSDLLIFNPRPIKLAEFIYDRYIDIKVPAHKSLLDAQLANPQSTTNFGYFLTDGVYLADQNTIYFEYHEIIGNEFGNGINYMTVANEARFAFNNSDNFDLLIPRVRRADDGDYFEYFAEYNGNSIEDFIYALNGRAGNNYYIIHDMRVIEQVGATFYTTDSFSSIQNSNYDVVKRIRPILQYPDTALAFSFEYTVRLYNASDGTSIFKTASYTFTDPDIFGKQANVINVGGVSQPIKVFNKLGGKPILDIKENILNLTKTKLTSTFYNSLNVIAKSDGDINQDVAGIQIKIDPFDNLFKFNVMRDDKEEVSIIKLDTISEYFMVFVKNDASEYRIGEFKNEQFNKTEGELAFKIKKLDSTEIRRFKNKNFYVTVKNPNGVETVIFAGTFEVE